MNLRTMARIRGFIASPRRVKSQALAYKVVDGIDQALKKPPCLNPSWLLLSRQYRLSRTDRTVETKIVVA